jgi:hypothetical protein
MAHSATFKGHKIFASAARKDDELYGSYPIEEDGEPVDHGMTEVDGSLRQDGQSKLRNTARKPNGQRSK